MKNIINILNKSYLHKFSIILFSVFLVISCSKIDDAGKFQYDSELTKGVSFTILNISSPSFEFSDPTNAKFSLTGEFRTPENGNNVKSVKVYTTFKDNTVPTGGTDISISQKVLIKEYMQADLTTNVNGLKQLDLSVTLTEALNALGLAISDVLSTDTFTITEEVELNDGTIHSSGQIANSLKGSGYNTPLSNVVALGCGIPTDKFAGMYEMIITNNTGFFPSSATVELKSLDNFGAREFDFTYAGGFARSVKFNLVCDVINVVEVSTGLACGGAGDIIFTESATVSPFNLANDSSITFNLLETGSCGLNETITITLTKL